MARAHFAFALLSCIAWTSHGLGAQVGTALQQHRIGALEGGFGGVLEEYDNFGYKIAALGDLNGDGTSELAVSLPYNESIWILFLGADGRVIDQTKITSTRGRQPQDLTRLGDLDGDGITELAVGIASYLGPTEVDIHFLRADGSVRMTHVIAPSDPVFLPAVSDFDAFGFALEGLGDVDGDGVGDLVIGAPLDDAGPGVDNGALWIVRLQPDGSPKSVRKLSERNDGTGLPDTTQLGVSIASLGDLDGDGNPELLAGSPTLLDHSVEPQSSSLLILYLDANERVRRVSRILQEEFAPLLDSAGEAFQCAFAREVTVLGDVDSDGTIEFVVGAPLWTPNPDSPTALTTQVGAFLVCSLSSDGTLARSVLVSAEHGGFTGALEADTLFGGSLAALGDLDHDGAPELAVGASEDSAAGHDFGAIWMVELDGSAVRNGSGRNPLTLAQDGEPAIGQPWGLTLDCSAHGRGLALVGGYERPRAALRTSLGELLVDLTNQRMLLVEAHNGTSVSFQPRVPNDPALFGLPVYLQGICSGAPRAQLSNALDVVIGR